jgi:hypothetical protein
VPATSKPIFCYVQHCPEEQEGRSVPTFAQFRLGESAVAPQPRSGRRRGTRSTTKLTASVSSVVLGGSLSGGEKRQSLCSPLRRVSGDRLNVLSFFCFFT